MDDPCVVCQRKVQHTENYVKCHLLSAFASFHWNCLGNYLRAESEPQVETNVWKASSVTKSN